MKKALSILLALVMVIGVFPTFADTKAEDKKAEKPAVEVSASEKALEALKGYGAIKGDGTADPFKMESELKRQNAAVILVRLLGVENEAKATEVKEKPFTDLPNDEFYKSIIQYVKAKGIFKGTSSEKFGFNEAITAQQFATINLRALGYEVDTDEAYGKALEQAKKLGLLKDASALENNTKIMRKDVYVIMNNTLETPKKGGKKALKYELGYATEPVVEKLEVVDAMANGLGVLKVEFTKPVDEDSLKAIEITDKDENDVKFTAHLSEDGKVANLELNPVTKQNETLKVVAENVKSADRKEKLATKFEKKVLFVDTDRPVVSSVEALNPREIVIAVSEPIKITNTSYKKYEEIKIDDKAVYGKIENNFDGKLTLTLYKALKEGEHKVVIEGLKDFADLPSAAYEQDITVVDDKEAPVAAEAKLLTSKSIKVTFNENLEKIGDFKIDGDRAKANYYKKSKKEIELTLTGDKELKMGAIVEVKVEYKGQKDIMGNEVKNWEKLTFSVADDTDLPTAEFKAFDKDHPHMVQIQFSKAMNKEGEWKLKDSKGKVVEAGKVLKTGGQVSYENEGDQKKEDKSVLVFTLNKLKNEEAKDYTLVLEKFKDATVRHNEMPKTEIEFKGKDAKVPYVIDGGYTYDPKEHAFVIAFSEKMNLDTLKDKTNYTVDGKRLDQYTGNNVETKIKVLEDGRKIHIIIKNDANINGTQPVMLIGLKDENGQKLELTSELLPVPDPTPSVVDVEVTKNDKDESSLKVKFLHDVKIVDASAFRLYTMKGTEKVIVGSLAFEGEIDNYAKEFNFAVDGYVFKDDLDEKPNFEVGKEAVSTARGKKNDAELSGTLVDKIAPRIKLDSDDEKMVIVESPKSIKIVFTETLGGIVVNPIVTKENKNVETTGQTATQNFVRVNLKEPMKAGEEYTVSLVVKDAHNNETGIIKESVTVTSLDDFNQTLNATIEAGDQVGFSKITVNNADGANELAYLEGEHLHVVGAEVNGTKALTSGQQYNLAGQQFVTVYELKTVSAKKYIVKYVVLPVGNNIGMEATGLEKITVVAGSGTDLTGLPAELLDGSGAVVSVAPTIGNFDTAATKKIKIAVDKAAGKDAQTVKVELTGSITATHNLTGGTNVEETPELEVTAKSAITVKVTVTEGGKVAKVYNTTVNVN